MATVTLKASTVLLLDLLRLHGQGQITGARLVDNGFGPAIEFTLDDPDIPEGIVEIEPQYTRSASRDPVNLSGISYRHADGHWERPQPIGPAG